MTKKKTSPHDRLARRTLISLIPHANMMPQRQFPIRSPHRLLSLAFTLTLPLLLYLFLSLPLRTTSTAHLPAQGVERRCPWRHGAFQPTRGAGRGRHLGHLPRSLLLGFCVGTCGELGGAGGDEGVEG